MHAHSQESPAVDGQFLLAASSQVYCEPEKWRCLDQSGPGAFDKPRGETARLHEAKVLTSYSVKKLQQHSDASVLG